MSKTTKSAKNNVFFLQALAGFVMIIGLLAVAKLFSTARYDAQFSAEHTTASAKGSGGQMAVNNPSDFASPWGVYPNCIAPATPMEVHSWWHEKGELHPRHVHLGTCMPNALSKTSFYKVAQKTPIVARIVVFNNPGVYNYARWSDESNVIEKNTFNGGTKCQQKPDEMKECTFYVSMTIDPAKFSGSGIREIRLTPDMGQPDLNNTRQFATLNVQTYIDNGRSRSDTRKTTDPFGENWYTDIKYLRAIINYEDFFKSPTESIPTVKGVVNLKVCHALGSGGVGQNRFTSYLFLNPDFHKDPMFHENPTNVLDPATGKLAEAMLYKKDGLFCGTYAWDTTKVNNGKNTLYFQTENAVDNFGSTKISGSSATAIKLFFNVAN